MKMVAHNKIGTNLFSPPHHYPFGSIVESRSWKGDYRYGFNGKEEDKEGLGGGGSTYDYGFRIYNGQIGKFLSVDPLFQSYPWYTPFQFAGNMPIWAIDLDGLEQMIKTRYKDSKGQINETVLKASNFSNDTWNDIKKTWFLSMGNKAAGTLWSSKQQYDKYTLGMGDGKDHGWYGPGKGILTIDGTGKTVQVTFDDSKVESMEPKSVSMGESVEMAVEAISTFVFNPNPLVEGSQKFNSTMKNYITAVTLPITGYSFISAVGINSTKSISQVIGTLAGTVNGVDDLSSLATKDGKTVFEMAAGKNGSAVKTVMSITTVGVSLLANPRSLTDIAIEVLNSPSTISNIERSGLLNNKRSTKSLREENSNGKD